jgi:hypothetical protein
MDKGKIFEYAVIYHPRTKKDEEHKRSVLVVDVKRAICADQQEALILASREIPDQYLDKLDQVEIAVRPF